MARGVRYAAIQIRHRPGWRSTQHRRSSEPLAGLSSTMSKWTWFLMSESKRPPETSHRPLTDWLDSLDPLVGHTPDIVRVRGQLREYGPVHAPLWIVSSSLQIRRLIARSLHQFSPR